MGTRSSFTSLGLKNKYRMTAPTTKIRVSAIQRIEIKWRYHNASINAGINIRTRQAAEKIKPKRLSFLLKELTAFFTKTDSDKIKAAIKSGLTKNIKAVWDSMFEPERIIKGI